VAQIAGFRQALAKAEQEKAAKRSAIRGSHESMIRKLEDELREYDQVKTGELQLPHIERLDEIRSIRREDPDCERCFPN